MEKHIVAEPPLRSFSTLNNTLLHQMIIKIKIDNQTHSDLSITKYKQTKTIKLRNVHQEDKNYT